MNKLTAFFTTFFSTQTTHQQWPWQQWSKRLQILLVLCALASLHVWNTPLNSVAWLGVGLLLGWMILILDVVYLQKQFELILPITRTVLFGVCLLGLAVFVMTSTTSLVGMGIVLGLSTGLAVEWTEILTQNQLAHHWLQLQFKAGWSERDQRRFLWLVWASWIVLVGMSIL